MRTFQHAPAPDLRSRLQHRGRTPTRFKYGMSPTPILSFLAFSAKGRFRLAPPPSWLCLSSHKRSLFMVLWSVFFREAPDFPVGSNHSHGVFHAYLIFRLPSLSSPLVEIPFPVFPPASLFPPTSGLKTLCSNCHYPILLWLSWPLFPGSSSLPLHPTSDFFIFRQLNL